MWVFSEFMICNTAEEAKENSQIKTKIIEDMSKKNEPFILFSRIGRLYMG
jgi:hypothetical protein